MLGVPRGRRISHVTAIGPHRQHQVVQLSLVTTRQRHRPAGQQFIEGQAGAAISTVAPAHDVMVADRAPITKSIEQAARHGPEAQDPSRPVRQ
jgi:hypothetical protein